MEDNCGYVYEHLVPAEGAVAVEVVDGGVSKDIRTVVKHVTEDGKQIREKKPRRAGLSMTKNAAPIAKFAWTLNIDVVKMNVEKKGKTKNCAKIWPTNTISLRS